MPVIGGLGHSAPPTPRIARAREGAFDMTNYQPSDAVRRIRAGLEHPIIDSDGHLIEFLPLVRDLLVDLAGESVAQRFDFLVESGKTIQGVSDEIRKRHRITQTPWWGIPTRNTLDRATAMLPRLLYERLDELGLDVAVLYPTYGLIPIHINDEELRRAMAAAFNAYLAEQYAPYCDRLIPVACIPTFTPEEAVAELEHAVVDLGLRAVMMGGAVPRPIPEGGPGAIWMDGLGHGSLYDYDPLWRRCAELGVSPTFHSTGSGWGSRMSTNNFVYNHIGNFAAAGELTARSLLMGGVPLRFPELRFAFQEGGTAWACNLYSDVIGHWEKRNAEAVRRYDPSELDRGMLASLFDEFSEDSVRERLSRLDEGLNLLSEPMVEGESVDDFAESLIGSPKDIRHVFSRQYFFGCEADDPMAAVAFDERLNPLGARIPALFASDIGHWDVPDFRGVLEEAWELVEHGLLDPEGFRQFTFANPVRLWTGTNPKFFEGTRVEDAVREELTRL
jgi:predicted TIM-barrel fold metal-dependent hydrolase